MSVKYCLAVPVLTENGRFAFLSPLQGLTGNVRWSS